MAKGSFGKKDQRASGQMVGGCQTLSEERRLKIDRIILCGTNGSNEIFIEYQLPFNFTGEVNFNFGQGGICGAWKTDRKRLAETPNGFNEKKYLDILKNNCMIVGNNNF